MVPEKINNQKQIWYLEESTVPLWLILLNDEMAKDLSFFAMRNSVFVREHNICLSKKTYRTYHVTIDKTTSNQNNTLAMHVSEFPQHPHVTI